MELNDIDVFRNLFFPSKSESLKSNMVIVTCCPDFRQAIGKCTGTSGRSEAGNETDNMYPTHVNAETAHRSCPQQIRGNGTVCVKDGICVDPPLCCGTSQGKYGSCTKGLVCLGKIVGKIGEVGERELVLAVSARCGKE